VLLSEKTRKGGGWRAKLVHRELAGPITNTAEVPVSEQVGQVVNLPSLVALTPPRSLSPGSHVQNQKANSDMFSRHHATGLRGAMFLGCAGTLIRT
jgi:hypothetical protein